MGLDLVSHLHLTVLSTLFSVYWHNALDLSGIAGIMPCMCPNSIGIIAFFCDAIRKQTYFYGACLSSMDWLAMHIGGNMSFYCWALLRAVVCPFYATSRATRMRMRPNITAIPMRGQLGFAN